MNRKVSETSVKAYLESFEWHRTQRGYIFDSIVEAYQVSQCDMTNLEISKWTGYPINIVTARVNELRRLGLLEFSQKRPCGISGFEAKTWKI